MNRIVTPRRRRSIAVPAIAATFNLEDPDERRIFSVIQRFYGPDEVDRLHDIKRGFQQAEDGSRRVAWTLGSFQPRRRGAKAEWSVITWNIDEIEFRARDYPTQEAARAAFAAL